MVPGSAPAAQIQLPSVQDAALGTLAVQIVRRAVQALQWPPTPGPGAVRELMAASPSEEVEAVGDAAVWVAPVPRMGCWDRPDP